VQHSALFLLSQSIEGYEQETSNINEDNMVSIASYSKHIEDGREPLPF